MTIWAGALIIAWVALSSYAMAKDPSFTTGKDYVIGGIVGAALGAATAFGIWALLTMIV